MADISKLAQKIHLGCFTWVLMLGGCIAKSAPPIATEILNVSVTVPDAGWRLKVERIVEREADVWILVQLERQPGAAAQVISTVVAPISVKLPAKPRRIFVAGKTWNWANEEPYEFVPELLPMLKQAEKARVLFPAPR